MGIVYVDGYVRRGDLKIDVRFLVDSGATYTVLKRDVWRRLDLKPKRVVELILADGTTIRRQLSEAIIGLEGYGEYTSPVIMGEAEDENLLGMVTLEIFGLILDPLKRELRPIRALLK